MIQTNFLIFSKKFIKLIHKLPCIKSLYVSHSSKYEFLEKKKLSKSMKRYFVNNLCRHVNCIKSDCNDLMKVFYVSFLFDSTQIIMSFNASHDQLILLYYFSSEIDYNFSVLNASGHFSKGVVNVRRRECHWKFILTD